MKNILEKLLWQQWFYRGKREGRGRNTEILDGKQCGRELMRYASH